jgi:hypothetical protein
MNHTPGPWYVNPDNNVKSSSGQTIALLYRENVTMSVREELKNAALLAASPELLWALETSTLLLERELMAMDPNATYAIDSLIFQIKHNKGLMAKAKGE